MPSLMGFGRAGTVPFPGTGAGERRSPKFAKSDALCQVRRVAESEFVR